MSAHSANSTAPEPSTPAEPIEKMNGTLVDPLNGRKWREIKISVPWGHVSGKWWGSQTQQPVLAIHGWQDNAGTFDSLLPLLPKNIAVLAIDLPGHGLSSHLPPGQTYSLLSDGPLLVRRIVKLYNWKPITILGHSLGGIIGFVYAGLFPDDIKKLIQIDIANPTIRDVSRYSTDAAAIIDKFLKYEELTDAQAPCYCYEEMLGIVEDAYKGGVTRKSCEILMKRGMSPSPKGSGFIFARDVRLKVAGFGFPTKEQVLHLAGQVRCDVLNIKGKPGMLFDRPEYYQMVLNKMREKTSVEFHEVEGTHHLHLNTPERISDLISNFLLKS